MSEFDPDNRVGAGGGAGFNTIKQGGNVSSRLPGRRTFGEGDGVGTTTVQDLKNSAPSAAEEEKPQVWASMQPLTKEEMESPGGE
jgi:hypothetical protein